VVLYHVRNRLKMTSKFNFIFPKISFSFLSSSPITKKYTNGNQNSQIEDQTTEIPSEKKPENESFDDDISKLSFKEKMTLFNKKKSIGLTPTSSLKTNRNRLTQVFFIDKSQPKFFQIYYFSQ
jgi:hypothetical protein